MMDILFVDKRADNFIWAFDGKFNFHQYASGLPFVVSESAAMGQNDLQRIQPFNSGMDPFTDIYYYIENQNGEAQTDIMYISKGDFTFTTMQGAKTYIATESSQATQLDLSKLKFMDFEGDGETDMLEILTGPTRSYPLLIHKSINQKRHI